MNNITSRELFLDTIACKATSRRFVWNWNFGHFAGGGTEFWQSTVDRWYNEGLPKDIVTANQINSFFGVDPYILKWNIEPKKDSEQYISEDERFEVIKTGLGNEIVRRFKGCSETSMESHNTYPIETRKDWNEFKSRFDSNDIERFNFLQPLYEDTYNAGGVGGFCCGALYGWLRNWFGIENFSYLLYDDEAFIHEILEYTTSFIIDVITKNLKYVPEDQIQMFHFWEDMASNTGSLISPVLYKEIMGPYYVQIIQNLKKLYPKAVFTLDSDGNVESLIPFWLENEITCIFPMEVAAGMDVVALKKKYGSDIQLIGGIDKREISKTRDDIEREIERIMPAYDCGGYMPDIDHSVPPDISFDNYCYYKEYLDKLCTR